MNIDRDCEGKPTPESQKELDRIAVRRDQAVPVIAAREDLEIVLKEFLPSVGQLALDDLDPDATGEILLSVNNLVTTMVSFREGKTDV